MNTKPMLKTMKKDGMIDSIEGSNFLKNFGDKVQIRNRTKVVEIIIRKRRFLSRG